MEKMFAPKARDEKRILRVVRKIWCGRRDLNPYGREAASS
jgi:hypothetical protein